MRTLPCTRQCFFLSGLAFLVVLIVAFTADAVLLRHPQWMFVDDVLLAVAAALVVFRYESQRSRALAEKLRVIRDMNAFVRNELQILYASMDRPANTRVPAIERSVERIDWALRELLPGREAPANQEQRITDHARESVKRSA